MASKFGDVRDSFSVHCDMNLSSTSTFCLFGHDAKISLAQIILGSDYSGSVKELQLLRLSVSRKGV